MIKKSALKPRLAEVGKIKIGGKGETRKSKKGGEYQLPVRYGHFVVTTTMRDKTGNYIPNQDVMEQLGEKPRELPIRLLFDSIEMNLQTEFAMYHGKKKACFGDGETAKRLKKDARGQLTNEYEGVECTCPLLETGQCKPSARLFCVLPYSMELGGVYVFRTHSFNSVMSMIGALEFFKQNTNGVLQGLPFKLKMVKKQTEEHGEIDFVTIVLDGMQLLEMRKAALEEAQNRKQFGVKIDELEISLGESVLLIDDDDPAEVEEEFYSKDKPEIIDVEELTPEKEPEQIEAPAEKAKEKKKAKKSEKKTEPTKQESEPQAEEQEGLPTAFD